MRCLKEAAKFLYEGGQPGEECSDILQQLGITASVSTFKKKNLKAPIVFYQHNVVDVVLHSLVSNAYNLYIYVVIYFFKIQINLSSVF